MCASRASFPSSGTSTPFYSVRVLKYPTATPADVTPLEKLKAAGHSADQVLAVAGKTEGNGCVNDFSRTLAAAVWEPRLPPSAVTVFSGGTEGVLSPHVTFIVRDDTRETKSGLLAAVGRTRALTPGEIGTVEHARLVQETVFSMLAEGGVKKNEVHLVLIKCPLLTSSKMAAIRQQGGTPITTDTYTSMAKSRYACAVGIAAALGEMTSDQDADLGNLGHLDDIESFAGIWSGKASCSSGAELEDNHILVLASVAAAEPPTTSTSSSSSSPPRFHATSTYMKDAIDAEALLRCQAEVHAAGGTVVQVFAKAEADPGGLVRGARHTMNTDSDIHSTRHARAAVGGLVAGIYGDPAVYVSGGAEGQGPPGGGSLCVVYRT